jgi:hypothetical protein
VVLKVMTKPNNDTLSQYLAAFTAEAPVLNRGLRAGELFPRAVGGQPGIFQYGLEELYRDDLNPYDAPQLKAPATFLSGLEASPVVALDTGSELSLKAVQIFLNMSRYKGADGRPLSEDGTWGKNSQFALAAWQEANAGKSGIASLQVDARRGRVWMPSNLAGEMRSKLALNSRGQAELARTDLQRSAASKKPTAADANVFETTASVRSILRALDVPVAPRGSVDPELVQGWQRAAKAFQLNPAVSAEPGAGQLFVDANTLSVLRVKARANRPGVAAPVSSATSTGNLVASSGTLPVQTSEVQRVLRALGWTKSVRVDGKFGPNTKKAWMSSATRRGLDATITGQAGAGLTYVSSATLARLQEDAAKGGSKGSSTEIQTVKTAPAPAPAVLPAVLPVFTPGNTSVAPPPSPAGKSEETPPRSGLSKVNVGTVQDVLLKLKFSVGKAGRDGFWGKATKLAWEKASTHRGLDALIAKASPTEAWVSPQTLEQLSAEAGGGVKKPDEPSPQPSAGDSDFVAVETKGINAVLRAFQKPLPKSAAQLVAVWKEIAKREKQDDRAMTKLVAGALVLYAPKSAADALVNEANLRLDLAKLLAASDTPVLMPTVQDAISFWSNQGPTKEKYGATFSAKSRGVWDPSTGVWMLRYLNIPRENIRMWERALPLLVASDQKSIKLPASFVPAFGTDAANYAAVKDKISANEKRAEKGEAREKKLQSILDARVRAATSAVSVRLLQQALSELYAQVQEGKIKVPPGLKVVPVTRTGVFDEPTYNMTLVAYGKDLIGKMDVRFFPDLMEKLLYTPASGVAGLSGFGVVGLGKTAMRVTPTVQKLINGAAGKWAARTQEILDASYVKGRIERGATAQQPNLDTRSSSSSSDTRSSATSDTRSSDVRNIVNERNVINERNVDNTTTSRVEQPSPAGPEPVGPVPTPAPSPAPEPPPELITPPTPTPSSGSSGWLWMLGAIGALGVGVAMSDKNKNKRSAPMRPSRR